MDSEHETPVAPEQVKVVFPTVLLTAVQVPREPGAMGHETSSFGETR